MKAISKHELLFLRWFPWLAIGIGCLGEIVHHFFH